MSLGGVRIVALFKAKARLGLSMCRKHGMVRPLSINEFFSFIPASRRVDEQRWYGIRLISGQAL